MKQSNMKRSSLCVFAAALMGISAATVTLPSHAADELASLFSQKSERFLPVTQAFKVSVQTNGNQVVATFNVTPKHYIYRDKLKLKLPDGVVASDWKFDAKPSMIDDPSFGKVAVFEESFTATATLTSSQSIESTAALRWQGCAKAGLCYPPEDSQFTIKLSSSADKLDSDQSPNASAISKPKNTNAQAAKQTDTKTDKKDADAQTANTADAKPSANLPSATVVTPILDDTDTDSADIRSAVVDSSDGSESINDGALATPSTTTAEGVDKLRHDGAASDPFGIQENPILAIGLLFLAGLLLSFTPCVYPMIPIVANIVARQGNVSGKKGLALSAAYGVGVATAYGLLGALIAWLGRAVNILGWLQNPVVLIVFAIIFALLALYMFDLVKVGLPSRLKDRLQSKSQAADDKLGSVGGSFVAGVLSALVVSPCVSAPMAGALAAVSVSDSVVFGFVALFALGLGLSIPLMIIGAAQGKIMPKAGEWMNHVKTFCGLLLLAVSLSLIERLLFSPVMLVLWALWFALVAVWGWKVGRWLTYAVALVSMLWTACLMIGVASGQSDPWRPLAGLSSHTTVDTQNAPADLHITTLAELDTILAQHDKVVVDITADWCVECRIMERTLFTNRPKALADYQLVKLDITQTTDDSRAVLARYQLFGPPALLFYKDGTLVNVLLGEVSRSDFEQELTKY
ncbi:protein-disulfide reductase DsbD [Moraxella nasovis]|uniref:protein-disulfide reductase DsbD n=1 Tax=Moraxella nasovis TaxID=2904121 RepID=UPI001F61B323|nr:protein-disulfide reductase DsbD [Moraxella nasovis]UNU73003.1 protein-disulfide reductase DsbD [Moraxella nasovis]